MALTIAEAFAQAKALEDTGKEAGLEIENLTYEVTRDGRVLWGSYSTTALADPARRLVPMRAALDYVGVRRQQNLAQQQGQGMPLRPLSVWFVGRNIVPMERAIMNPILVDEVRHGFTGRFRIYRHPSRANLQGVQAERYTFGVTDETAARPEPVDHLEFELDPNAQRLFGSTDLLPAPRTAAPLYQFRAAFNPVRVT